MTFWGKCSYREIRFSSSHSSLSPKRERKKRKKYIHIVRERKSILIFTNFAICGKWSEAPLLLYFFSRRLRRGLFPPKALLHFFLLLSSFFGASPEDPSIISPPLFGQWAAETGKEEVTMCIPTVVKRREFRQIFPSLTLFSLKKLSAWAGLFLFCPRLLLLMKRRKNVGKRGLRLRLLSNKYAASLLLLLL